jgi:glycerophosphoryl diester phosphodiesterase
MNRVYLLWLVSLANFLLAPAGRLAAQPASGRSPIVIAHRGSSGYLPEHTEGAKVLAVAQGADYVEQDVVLTRDRVFVVCHDVTLEGTTDVAERYPQRRRADGKFYAADFDWAEIQTLSVHERLKAEGKPAFPKRFPGGFHQKLMRLEDELRLLEGINQTLGKTVGIYVELKRPAWHRDQMKIDIERLFWKHLQELGYTDPTKKCFLQCFERESLQRLRHELKCPLPLIQLLSDRPEPKGKDGGQGWAETLREVRSYAEGIGPSIDLLVEGRGNEVVSSGLVEAAHRAGLLVHPYTVRRDSLPAWATSVDRLQAFLIDELKVDGFFTDFPDLGRRAVDR